MPPRHITQHANAGFTLVEMSIVLVIIGLLVGGILVGRDLIRAAELRSVISDIEKFKSAANTFKVKYSCIPGDCANATDFFGTDPGGCPNTPVNSVPKTATCNGNGDGQICCDSHGIIGVDYTCEQFRFWQQLADAGLIPRQYSGTGVAGHSGYNCDPRQFFLTGVYSNPADVGGINVPTGKLNDAVYTVAWFGTVDAAGWGTTTPVNYLNKNFIVVAPQSSYWSLGLLSPQDAYNIDSKVDDGLPWSGSVLEVVQMWYDQEGGGVCTALDNAPTNYLASSTKIGNWSGCDLAFSL
jgi:prepilin-type N-terminal cleavage/methylation domain-containing protein